MQLIPHNLGSLLSNSKSIGRFIYIGRFLNNRMLHQKEFITRLREFGLNTYESKLWTALLSRGVSTAGELSDIANVPRSRSYDVLESLQKKGFINLKLGKPIKYIAVEPEEVLERRKEIINERTEKHIELINELNKNKLLSEIMDLHLKGAKNLSDEELIGTIRGYTNIKNHIDTMIRGAKKNVSIFLSKKSFVEDSTYLLPVIQMAKTNGVNIMVYVQLDKTTESISKSLSNFADVIDSYVNARLVVVDEREILFML